MIVVSDTSPLNYLVLITADHVLPAIFDRVITTDAVLEEMNHPSAPPQVRDWAQNPPLWLEISKSESAIESKKLGPGESTALALARDCRADAVLIDDRDGRLAAKALGLTVIGTLAVVGLAAERSLLVLSDAITKLRGTTFHIPNELVAELMRADEIRRGKTQPPSE